MGWLAELLLHVFCAYIYFCLIAEGRQPKHVSKFLHTVRYAVSLPYQSCLLLQDSSAGTVSKVTNTYPETPPDTHTNTNKHFITKAAGDSLVRVLGAPAPNLLLTCCSLALLLPLPLA